MEENNKFVIKRFFKYLKNKKYPQGDVLAHLYADCFADIMTQEEFNKLFDAADQKNLKSSVKFFK